MGVGLCLRAGQSGDRPRGPDLSWGQWGWLAGEVVEGDLGGGSG